MREIPASRLRDLCWTVRVVGLARLWRIVGAYRLGWSSILSGFYKTRVLQALFNVGFFDELRRQGVVSPEAFAATHNVDARILTALCEALYALRILKKAGDGYALDAAGRLLVETGRGWFIATYGYEGVFHSLEALLRREREYGKDLRRRDEFVTRGYGELGKLIHFPLMLDIVARNGYRNVLDLGCGDGSFLLTLCEANREVMGVGVDASAEAVASGRERARVGGLDRRTRFLVGDIADLEAVGAECPEVDVATAFFVLHDLLRNGAEQVVELLRSFRVRFPGVPLVVFEVVRPTLEALRRRPGMSVHYFLYHELSRQRPMTRKEWQSIFRAAGFASASERYLGFARTSIYTLQ